MGKAKKNFLVVFHLFPIGRKPMSPNCFHNDYKLIENIFYLLTIIVMAFANSEKVSNVSPIEKFLEFRKGGFSCWNKETSSNEVHNMDRFVILDVVYTVRGAEWNDSLNQYTSRYYSNEIRDFKEKLYLIRMTFSNGQANKDLVVSGQWKAHIKPVLPKGAALNMGLIVYDLNDHTVKELFVQGNTFYKVSQFIRGVSGDNILGFNITTGYTDGRSDKDGNDVIVTEEYVDGLKGTEAAKYKKRYLIDIYDTGEIYEDKDNVLAMAGLLDEYYLSRKKSYIDKYDLGKVEELVPGEFYVPEGVEEDIETETIKPKEEKPKVKIEDDISIDELPW